MGKLLDSRGLSMFKMPSERLEADDPIIDDGTDEVLWPALSVACDQGSDGVCALTYMQRKKRLLAEEGWCGSHGSWRDFQKMIRDSGNHAFWMLLLLVMNVVHGPWGDAVRHKQATEAFSEMRQYFRPDSFPLYDEWCAHMVWERSPDGQVHAGSTQRLGDLRASHPFRPQGLQV